MTMISEDQAYFLRRAEAEVALAHRSADENAARAHYELAGHYWDRAFNAAQVSSDSRPATATPVRMPRRLRSAKPIDLSLPTA